MPNAERQIRTALLDFYDMPLIDGAKKRLLNDVSDICADFSDDIGRLQVTADRRGENRVEHTVDDIFTLLKFLDMHKLIEKLPRYVTDNPDMVPSMRLYEGDFKVILAQLGKMENKMASYDTVLSTICRDLNTLQVSWQAGLQVARGPFVVGNPGQAAQPAGVNYNMPRGPPAPGPFIPQPWVRPPPPVLQPVINSTMSSAVQSQMRMPADVVAITTGNTTQCPLMSTQHVTTQAPVRAPLPHNATDTVFNAGHPERTQTARFNAVQTLQRDSGNSHVTSSPFIHRNRFDVLSLSTDDESGQTDSGDQFTFQESRRARRIRRREESSQRRGAPPSARRSGARLLTGESQRSSGQVTAARKWTKRQPSTVLYIDNLSKNCTRDDLVSFVTGLSVSVISCYKVTPRHRRGQEPDRNRSAFRLCIPIGSLDVLLDPSVWPDSVTISEWYWMDPSASRPEKRGRFSMPSPPVNSDSRTDDRDAASGGEDMESTIIYTGAESATSVKSPSMTATGTTDQQHDGVVD